MIKDIWRVITGRLSWTWLTFWRETAIRNATLAIQAKQLKRDLGLAQAAIAELKSQLSMAYVEAARRQESDDLAAQVLEDMKDNPEKYIAPSSDKG